MLGRLFEWQSCLTWISTESNSQSERAILSPYEIHSFVPIEILAVFANALEILLPKENIASASVLAKECISRTCYPNVRLFFNLVSASESMSALSRPLRLASDGVFTKCFFGMSGAEYFFERRFCLCHLRISGEFRLRRTSDN
jgi:hypothetical protein